MSAMITAGLSKSSKFLQERINSTRGRTKTKVADCDIPILPKDLNVRNRGNFEDFYDIGEELGSGSFGKVVACIHHETAQKRAVKILFKKEMSFQEREKLLNESKILSMLSHPNILKLFEVFEDFDKIYVVTDIYQGGELFDEIILRKEFKEKDAAVVLRQLLSCISYCHGENIVHRDLKPENVMLEKNKELDQIKLIDFGHATFYDTKKPNNKEFLTKKYGTPYYIAPEVLREHYNHKCDIWSVGVIAYILLSGYPPFSGDTNSTIFGKVMAGKFNFDHPCWNKVSKQAKDFVVYLLTYDYRSRPTARSALKHSFLKQAQVATDKKALTVARNSRFSSTESVETDALFNLRTFNIKYKLKQVVYAYIVSQLLSKSDREELADIFRKCDKNGDGLLSKHEIRKAFKTYLGEFYDRESVNELFAKIDVDRSGKVDYSEFLMAATSQEVLLNKVNIDAVFRIFDKDNNNYITTDEIKEVLNFDKEQESKLFCGGTVDDLVEEMINEADADGDGRISKQEFVSLLTC